MPSYKIYQQARANSIKMVKLGFNIPSKYNNIPFDSGLFKEQFKHWENSNNYAQKFQFEDRTAFQISSNANSVSLYLVDCNGRIFKSYPAPNVTVGNTVNVQGVDYTTFANTWQVEFSSLNEGIYYLYCVMEYPIGMDTHSIEYYISEPISLATKHINTLLFEYTHPRNQYETVFVNGSGGNTTAFSLRAEGMIESIDQKSSDIQYNDQDYDAVMLNSYPYRTFQLNMGHVSGLAPWVWDKLNIILGLKSVAIEGVYYTKDDGAQWSKIEGDRKVWPTITIRESDNYSGLTWVSKAPIVLFTITTYPFVVAKITIDATNYFLYFLVESDTTALLSYLNSTFKPSFGFKGTFVLNGTSIVYNQDESESFSSGSAQLLNKYYSIHIPSTTTATTLSYNFTYSWIYADFGNGNALKSGGGISQSQAGTTGYAANTTYSIRIFHQDTITASSLSGICFDNVSGTISSATSVFSFTNMNASIFSAGTNSFDAAVLTPALANLSNITISNCGINSLLNLVQQYAHNPLSITIGNNRLSTMAIDGIFNLLYLTALSYSPLRTGSHSIYTKNQVPVAPPTVASSTARTYLAAHGWTITTD